MGNRINPERVYQRVYDAVREMHLNLPPDVQACLVCAAQSETGQGKRVLECILRNLEEAVRHHIPLCQDTGMVWVYVLAGEDTGVRGLRETISRAVQDAYCDGYCRPSIVVDPLDGRKNTDTNLPAVFHFEIVPGSRLEIHILAKGFGSENCSRVFMLNPTQGREAVIDAVCQVMQNARGAPCPPVVLGVGIGGTLDYAAFLSKKALTRALNDHHASPYYAALEADLLQAVNALGIGAGGLGGRHTALAVKVEAYGTHMAGLPVAVTVNCWADRRAKIVMEQEECDA